VTAPLGDRLGSRRPPPRSAYPASASQPVDVAIVELGHWPCAGPREHRPKSVALRPGCSRQFTPVLATQPRCGIAAGGVAGRSSSSTTQGSSSAAETVDCNGVVPTASASRDQASRRQIGTLAKIKKKSQL
jgi:hypothetical protein